MKDIYNVSLLLTLIVIIINCIADRIFSEKAQAKGPIASLNK